MSNNINHIPDYRKHRVSSPQEALDYVLQIGANYVAAYNSGCQVRLVSGHLIAYSNHVDEPPGVYIIAVSKSDVTEGFRSGEWERAWNRINTHWPSHGRPDPRDLII